MQENLPVNCRSCEKEVLMKDIKFDDINNRYICKRCYNKDKPTKHTSQNISQETQTKSKSTTVTEQPELVEYMCKNCSYEFSRKKSRNITECPYCAEDQLLVK